MDLEANNKASPGLATRHVAQLSERVYLIYSQTLPGAMFVTGLGEIIGNILTVLVYIRLGVKETIHLSYVTLAVSDFGCVITTIWIGVCHSPIMEATLARLRLKTDIETSATYKSAWLHFGFSRTTALLSAWISQERCLLVTFPSRVKVTIPPVVTKVVLVLIYAIGL